MWWVNRIPKHLPFSTGNFVPGCVDVMLGYTREDPFMRLFYPTNSEHNEKVNHKKWIPWIEDDNYLVGIAKVIKVPIIILRLVFWWCTNLHVPVSYGEKSRTEDKLKCIVMSHGLGGNRFLYSKVCCDLASRGFLVACLEHRQCILLDPWMFPIKDEKLEDRIKFPILFLNTQTFHIESNVKTMAKFLTNETVEMYTILGTTHENQTDSVLVVGYWLNWMMRKIDPHLALKINNALILTFLHRCMKTPADIQESEQFLEAMKEFYEEGLTKPWL
ncbi:platelet-activating factor acetylhydrolase isoform X2 [Leptinotarsa decemlineata]|uniref:platelet-activating factor acetylhydrolase isoform X2 n=1 Tax=Leptinotarsa decemlineata TaxID=7539 RepID=UPI003D307783